MTRNASARLAWQGAMASAALNLVGTPLDLMMGRSIPGMPAWPNLLSMSVGGTLLAFLVAARHHPTARAASVVFLANNAAVVLALWVASGHYAAADPAWVPFQANKLGVLAVAMLTPANLPVGITTILLFTAGAIGKYWTFDDAIRHRLPVSEPWSMVAFAVFAVFLFVYRLRRKSLERELLAAQVQKEAAERSTQRLLAIQDLANTPLQTLEANTALLARVPGTERYVARMRRALDRLQDWSRILREECDESAPSGTRPLLESFDAKRVLVESQRPPKMHAAR
jgi:hypothetical protein